MSDAPKFNEWAIVEVMGHQKYAGIVTEQAIGGCAFVRVDVPRIEADGRSPEQQAFTKLLGQGSIFAITPVSESVARTVAATTRAAPVHVYDLPSVHHRALPIASANFGDNFDEDFQDEEADDA